MSFGIEEYECRLKRSQDGYLIQCRVGGSPWRTEARLSIDETELIAEDIE